MAFYAKLCHMHAIKPLKFSLTVDNQGILSTVETIV